MLSLLFAVMLTQAPSGPVVALHDRPAPGSISDRHLEEVLTVVQSELARAGVTVTLMPSEVKKQLQGTDALRCVRGLDCLFRVGTVVNADALISIEATELAGDIAVSLEAVAPKEERRVARHSTVVKASKLDTVLAQELRAFAEQVALSLRPAEVPRAEPPVAEAPPVTEPGPSIATPPPVASEPAQTSPAFVQIEPSARRSRVPAYAAVGGATVAAGAATWFAISGFGLAGEVNAASENDPEVRRQTFPSAQQTANQANTQLTVAAVSAGVAAALTTAAILLWQD